MNLTTAEAMRRAMRRLNQRPIMVYPIYVKLAGGLEGGVLLGQLAYWSSIKDGEPFSKTDDELRHECALTRREFDRAKQAVRSLRYVKIYRAGMPARTWYQVDDLALLDANGPEGLS